MPASAISPVQRTVWALSQEQTQDNSKPFPGSYLRTGISSVTSIKPLNEQAKHKQTPVWTVWLMNSSVYTRQNLPSLSHRLNILTHPYIHFSSWQKTRLTTMHRTSLFTPMAHDTLTLKSVSLLWTVTCWLKIMTPRNIHVRIFSPKTQHWFMTMHKNVNTFSPMTCDIPTYDIYMVTQQDIHTFTPMTQNPLMMMHQDTKTCSSPPIRHRLI